MDVPRDFRGVVGMFLAVSGCSREFLGSYRSGDFKTISDVYKRFKHKLTHTISLWFKRLPKGFQGTPCLGGLRQFQDIPEIHWLAEGFHGRSNRFQGISRAFQGKDGNTHLILCLLRSMLLKKHSLEDFYPVVLSKSSPVEIRVLHAYQRHDRAMNTILHGVTARLYSAYSLQSRLLFNRL